MLIFDLAEDITVHTEKSAVETQIHFKESAVYRTLS